MSEDQVRASDVLEVYKVSYMVDDLCVRMMRLLLNVCRLYGQI